MNTHVFLITAKTNLHVGNESGGDFSIIDKAIQRDPLTGLPCINSSSLKGAINEFCSKWADSCLRGDENAELRKRLFGSDKTGKEKDSQKGEAIFFDAKLLFLPQQSDKDEGEPYTLKTSKAVIDMMNERVGLFCPGFKYECEKEKQISHELFKSICSDDNLPIIARNVLDNGESKNLWYEQVLPAETVLYTIIREKDNDLANALKDKLVQIGAGATIGYGYCKFNLFKTIEGTKEG